MYPNLIPDCCMQGTARGHLDQFLLRDDGLSLARLAPPLRSNLG